MNVTKVLLDILVVLLVAKAAAEVAERLKVPAVVGEIVAGIVIGPSALGLVQGGDVLRVLGEIGVILLLLDVGLEMDLSELAAVGRASVSVAVVGVAVPFALGWIVGSAFGMSANEAMFVGAALTATSVGITARVFGDLRALATVEARTVLGAAVADDVIGLVILTVVVRLAAEGHVAPMALLSIIGIAVGFLVLTSICGVRLAPGLFSLVARTSRSSGTLVAVALAFTLAVAELASAAQLAPIVGAFVAGISLARCSVAGRIRRELTPVGHLFIPVFFLQIGIDAHLGEFAHASVLRLAGALLLVAVVGKLASAAGLWGSPGDRLLVGVGMIPRGEVGLIFATLGLREHIFGQDVYAAVLLVVLATTLLTPPLLKWRLLRLRAAPATPGPGVAKPEGGWLEVLPGPGGASGSRRGSGGMVELAAEPPLAQALPIALEAAVLGGKHRPGPRLLDWLGRLPETPLRWDRAARERLFQLLDQGGPRSWRFLALTGILERALPELGEALARRQADPFELDPTGALRWPTLSRLQEGRLQEGRLQEGRLQEGRLQERGGGHGGWPVEHPERLLLAAIILDATDGGDAAVPIARRIVKRLDLGAAVEQAVAGLVADVNLLPAAARRLDSLSEESVLQLAVHLRSAEQARALALLAEADESLTPLERDRVHQLHELLQVVLAHPELTGRNAANAVEQRRTAAVRLTTDPAARERIAAAPRAYLLATAPADIAHHAAMCEPPPGRDETRVRVEPVGIGRWRVDLAARDRVGLLAVETDVIARAGADILDATVATWGDGCALASFVVAAPSAPDPGVLGAELRANLKHPPSSAPVPDAVVAFDDESSPWHTVCHVEAPDRPGLLHALTAAFAAAGVSVHSAKVSTVGGKALDLFELTDRHGHKLNQSAEEDVRRNLAVGVAPTNRRLLPWSSPGLRRGAGKQNGSRADTRRKQSGDRPEMTAP